MSIKSALTEFGLALLPYAVFGGLLVFAGSVGYVIGTALRLE